MWAIDPYGSQPLSLKYRPSRNPVKRDPMRQGPSDAPGTDEGSSGSGGMEG
jgi:hypothetical protein